MTEAELIAVANLKREINSVRLSILEHYLFLYGDEDLEGRNKTDLFEADMLDGELAAEYMETVMEVEHQEELLHDLLDQYRDIYIRSLEARYK